MSKLRPYTKFLITLIGGAVVEINVILVLLPDGATLADIGTQGWFVIVSSWLALAGGVFEGNNS